MYGGKFAGVLSFRWGLGREVPAFQATVVSLRAIEVTGIADSSPRFSACRALCYATQRLHI